MTIPTSTDLFLVNRNDISYYVTQANLMAQIKDDDLMLVNRADVSYKITGLDAKQSFVDPLTLTVTITPNPPIVSQLATAVAVPSGGKVPTDDWVYTYQWKTSASADGSSPTNIAGATASTYTPVLANDNLYLGCTVSTTDALGTSVTTTNFVGPVDVLEVAPQINTVTLTDLESNANRYTSSVFPYTVDMSEAGEPAPTYALKAKLTGATFDFGVESDTITAVTSTAGTQTYKTDTIANVADVSGWNQSQTWSNNVSGGSAGPWEAAFDGNLNTLGGNPDLDAATTCTWTAIPATTVEIYAYRGPSGSVPIILNPNNGSGGIDVSSLITGTSYQWWDVSSLFTDSTLSGVTNDRSGVTNGSVFVNINAYRVNGQELVNSGISGAPTFSSLTFPTDNNFDKFKVGDVVQSDYIVATVIEQPNNPYNNGGGWGNGDPNDPMRQRELGRWVVGPDSTVIGTQVKVKASLVGIDTSSSGNFNVIVNEGLSSEASTVMASANVPASGANYNTGTVTLSSAASIETIAVYPSDAPGTASGNRVSVAIVYIDEVELYQQELESSGNAYAITAIDDTVPSITTDGGSWYGADGTGTADAATTVDKNITYAGQLTVASDSKLAQITGGVYMTDGTFKTDGSGEYAPADYTLQTSTIASVVEAGFTYSDWGVGTYTMHTLTENV